MTWVNDRTADATYGGYYSFPNGYKANKRYVDSLMSLGVTADEMDDFMTYASKFGVTTNPQAVYNSWISNKKKKAEASVQNQMRAQLVLN